MTGVAILGYGIVGSGAGKIISQESDRLNARTGCNVRLKYVVDIKDVDVPSGCALTSDIAEALADDEVRIVIETIGGARVAYDYTKRALMAGKHVVTSNKELVATNGDELCALASRMGVRYLFEAAVGGAIPALFPITELLGANEIRAFSGIVNGTTNYMLTRMADSGASFSAAMGEAREMGYIEADPTADIDGWDARRKAAILANLCFGAKFSDDALIPFEGISKITQNDVSLAREAGMAIKLVAHGELAGDSWTGWVAPCLVRSESPLYSVRDVFNAILVTCDYAGDVMFYGRGAGSLPTASAVVGDVIQICRLDSALRPAPVLARSFVLDASRAEYRARLGDKFSIAQNATRDEAEALLSNREGALLRVI